MKRLLSIIISLCIIFTLSGFSTITPRVDITSTAATADKADTKISADLKKISQDLVLEMTKGNMKPVCERFTPLLRLQVTEKALKDVWEPTVAGLGKYIGIYEVIQETVNQSQVVYVILQYEYQGLKISLTYNASDQLEGLWINYTLIEEEAVETDAFKETKITFGEGEYPITGILTLPKSVKKPPVVILVPGSGNHDLNEVVGSNRPFRDIAWGLAEKGIASIRYNERLAMYPELMQKEKLTIQLDSLNDASDAINYALKSNKINKKKIFVVGHSLGGMMAPKLARDHKQIAGIVILAGSPRKLEDIVLDQATDAIMNAKLDDKVAKNYLDQTKKEIKEIKALKKGSDKVLANYPAHYWYSLNKIDIAAISKKLTIPMFVAQGSEDWQVYADKDYKKWQEVLKGKKNVTFKLYDKLNHLFVTSKGKTDITEYNIPDNVDKKVISDMAKWIKKN